MAEMDKDRQSESEEVVIPINSYSAESETDPHEPIAESDAHSQEAGTEAQVSDLEQWKAKVAELEEQKLRALADLENYKKRMARQFDDVVRTANDRLLGQILDVVDNFERALQHAGEDTDIDAMRKGMELIYTQLLGVLKQYELEPIQALGQPFDTNLHEAMLHNESDTYDEGIVSQELSRGYRIGDRVIRYTKVGVSKGKPTAE
jgi:molecular chaperone GrpE